jgi:glycosyltransferase involved in cell wall biosynthesis
MSKPRVLILGKLPPPYMGPAIATEILLNSDLKNQFELLHVNTKANDSLATLGKWSFTKFFRNIGIYLSLLSVILKRRPHLVLIPISQTTTGFLKDFFFIAVSKLTFRKVLIQLRGSNFKSWIDQSSWLTRKLVKTTLGTTQGVIVLGENLKYLFEGIFPSKNIFVVPNGGNYVIPKRVQKNAVTRILYLANLQSSKGIEDLLEASRVLKNKSVNHFFLDVAGDWRDERTKDKCMRLVEENNLPVHFYPAVSGEEKFSMLGNADVFVFTPRAPEGHPWVIVEAMAAGLPIISTDRGAITESVKHGVNGFIVGIQKPGEIADKMKLLIEDKELRQRMSEAGRKLYEANFTEEKMVDRYVEVFTTVIKTEPAKS